MQEITTDHERRARRAKATALATVLADAGSTPDDVAHLTPAAWRIAASAATQRQLLGTTSTGKVRTVHPPHSDATVLTVQTELANLLALRAAQDRDADQAAGEILAAAGYPDAAACMTSTRTATAHGDACDHCGALVDGPFVGLTAAEVEEMDDDQRAEHEAIDVAQDAGADESTPAEVIHFQTSTSTVRCGSPMRGVFMGPAAPHGWDLGNVTVDPAKVTCEHCMPRRATDSQGYRATVGQLDPETARTFAMFGQADRR